MHDQTATSAVNRRPSPPRLRTMLFVPGNREAWLVNAFTHGADSVIFDLEDAVPLDGKDVARRLVAEVVSLHGQEENVFVRINPLDTGHCLDDLEAVVRPGLLGIVVPKVLQDSDVSTLSNVLSMLERRHGMPQGQVHIVPILETAPAMYNAYALAKASDRVAYMGGLSVKGGDVERSVGYRWSSSGWESLAMRSSTLLAARAAGVHNPVTGLWTDVKDTQGLAEFARSGRDLGYEGMSVIHPSHVEVVNEAFSITREELEYYRGLVATLQEAERDGRSAVSYRGEMVDVAMLKTAVQKLSGAADAERVWERKHK